MTAPETGPARQPETWRQNFRAVWPSLFATAMGLLAILPMLPLYIQERFAIADERVLARWTAAIYGIAPLTAAVIGPVWGALGDRVGKKPMAIRANVAIAVTTALMPLMPTPFWLLAARFAQGAFAGYVAPSMALAAQGAPRERHGAILARLQVAMAAGTFVGPFAGAEIAHLLGRSAVFWLTSLLSLLAALRLLTAARDEPAAPRAGSTLLGAMLESGRVLLRNRVFRWLLVLVVLLRLGQNMLEAFLALFIRELGPATWIARISDGPAHAVDRTVGIAFGVAAVAQWFFTPLWGRLADRHGPLRCLGILAACLGVVLAATAAVASVDQFLALRAVAAAAMAGSMTLAYAAVSKRVDESRRALAFALVQSCMQLGFALAPQVGAAIATVAEGPPDYRRPFVAAGAICLLASVGMFGLRRLEAGREQ